METRDSSISCKCKYKTAVLASGEKLYALPHHKESNYNRLKGHLVFNYTTYQWLLDVGWAQALSAGSHIKDYTSSIGDDSSNDYYTARRKDQKTRGGERDKQYLRQKGQAVNKHRDILDAIHKVARYIDGFLLQSQNGCQICSTRLEEVPEKGSSACPDCAPWKSLVKYC